MDYDAIVLAGADSRRLDGADKPALVVGGSTMLQRVIAACAGAGRVVVAGPPRAAVLGVLWCQESPAGGGPVAALAAAAALIQAPVVLTLAADLPFVAPAVPVLLGGLAEHDVAVLVDVSGRRNLLAAAWQTASLRQRLAEVDPGGSPVRTLFGPADVIDVVDEAGWGRDCDTWPEVAAARAAAASAACPRRRPACTAATETAAERAATEERMP